MTADEFRATAARFRERAAAPATLTDVRAHFLDIARLYDTLAEAEDQLANNPLLRRVS